MVLVKLVLQWFYTDFTTGFSHFVMKLQSKNAIFFMMLNILDHGQSSYWIAKSSFVFLTSDQHETENLGPKLHPGGGFFGP